MKALPIIASVDFASRALPQPSTKYFGPRALDLTRAVAVALVATALAGCGVISIRGASPVLTTGTALSLVTGYYDTCHEYSDVGQCGSFAVTQTDCYSSSCYHISVRPPFARWVRIARQSSAQNESLSSREVPVLTSAGAKRCLGWSDFRIAPGNDASGCTWLYAPAMVLVNKVYQHEDIATIVATLRFSADPALVRYLRENGPLVGDVHMLDSLAQSQGRVVRLHVYYDPKLQRWIVGDRKAFGHGVLLIVIVIVLLLLLSAFGLLKQESTPPGATPNIGFSGDGS
jgi:hypothetical protein